MNTKNKRIIPQVEQKVFRLLTFLALISGLVSQGAWAQTIIYVNASAVGGVGQGTSWYDARLSLPLALSVAQPGDQIWVAKGTYKPFYMVGGVTARYAAFQMKDGVKI